MTEISRFWTGTSLGDAGAYSSDQMNQFTRYLGNAAYDPNVGVLLNSGQGGVDSLDVDANSPAAANVIVKPGAALVQGTWYYNNSSVTVAIPANVSGNPRIDTIVLQKVWSTQTVRVAHRQGTPAVSPTPPILQQLDGVIWEIPLADVSVASGFTTIAQADIQPRMLYATTSDGVYIVNVRNNSGITLNTGDVVIWDTLSGRAVTTTTLVGQRPAGVWLGRTANLSYGTMLVQGVSWVRTNAALATTGQSLITTSVAGRCTGVSPAGTQSGYNAFAINLETTAGAGLCLAYIDIPVNRVKASGQVVYTGGADFTTSSAVFSDVSSANLTLTIAAFSGTIMAEFSAYIEADNTGGSSAELDLIMDSTTRAGDVTHGLVRIPQNNQNHVTIVGRWTGLTGGNHTVRPQFRNVFGTAVTTVRAAGYPCVLRVWEA